MWETLERRDAIINAITRELHQVDRHPPSRRVRVWGALAAVVVVAGLLWWPVRNSIAARGWTGMWFTVGLLACAGAFWGIWVWLMTKGHHDARKRALRLAHLRYPDLFGPDPRR